MAMYATAAFWGSAQVLSPNNSLLVLATICAFSTAATFWFAIDRRILAKPHLQILLHLFFFSWPIATLIHLMTSRGLRGAGHWLMHSAGLLIAMCLAFYGTIILLSQR
jgi:hypothetical protein